MNNYFSFQFKSWFIIFLSILAIGYIYYTSNYYNYCRYGKITNDYLVEDEWQDIYKDLCSSIYKDYSGHTIMNYSLFSIYSLITDGHLNPYQIEKLRKKMGRTNYYSLKIEFKILQIIHILFYFIVLYFLVVAIPKKIIYLLLYFIDKVLFIIMFVFMLEGVVNIYFDINIDILNYIKFAYTYLPIGYIYTYIRQIIGLIY
jgi:hypothetical protein